MKTLFLFSCFLARTTAWCYTWSSRLSQVRLAMTQVQVMKTLGKLVSFAESKGGGKTLYYSLRKPTPELVYAPYSVFLLNGKVESYGRDMASPRPAAVPIIVPVVR